MNDEFKKGGYFPLEFFVEFLSYLKNNSQIEIITYADMAWCPVEKSETIYQAEQKNWQKKLREGSRDPDKIYVLIQHDVDSRPERSMKVVEEEIALGVPSNVMIFNRRHDRKLLKNDTRLQYTDYELDTELLTRAEQEHGFVIGYHCNAYEQALYNLDDAQQRMIDDIAELRKNFQIDFWSAHGGVPGENGINNNKIVVPDDLMRESIWVHNGATPVFDGNYSDGGLNNKTRDPRKRSLSEFAAGWKPGKRYRILTHPQYYNSPPQYNEWLATAQWYRDMFEVYKLSGTGGWISPATHSKVGSSRNAKRGLFSFFKSGTK